MVVVECTILTKAPEVVVGMVVEGQGMIALVATQSTLGRTVVGVGRSTAAPTKTTMLGNTRGPDLSESLAYRSRAQSRGERRGYDDTSEEPCFEDHEDDRLDPLVSDFMGC